LTSRYNDGYTYAMKTAISIPAPVFEAAERLARRLGKSRSQLYSEALAHYVEQHTGADVTERLDEALHAEPEADEIDPVLNALQLEVLHRERW
jgi:predicted DNA-binding protein